MEVDEKGRIYTAKLCDFGSCVVLRQPVAPSVVTARWSPPECIKPVSGCSEDSKSDSMHVMCLADLSVWSFGMLLYEILSLKLPFAEINLLDVKDYIVSGSLPSLTEVTQPKFVELLTKCWSYESSFRPTALELIKWFEETSE